MNNIIAKEILLEAKSIFDELEIRFFLIYGTCLGAVREGGFIGTDTDIDLGVCHEDLIPKFELLREKFKEHGFRSYAFSYPYRYPRSLNVYKYDILIDIRGFEEHDNGRFLQRVDSDRNDIADVYTFKEFKDIDFLGDKFKVPHPVENYLEENYGKGWRIPDPTMHYSYAGVEGWWQSLERPTILTKEERK